VLAGANQFVRDRQSDILDWNDRGPRSCSATVRAPSYSRRMPKPGVLGSVLHADGSHAGILSVPGNVCGGKIGGSPFLHMDGQAVFKFAVKVLDEVAARRWLCAA